MTDVAPGDTKPFGDLAQKQSVKKRKLYSEPLLLFENIFGTAAPTTIDTDVYKRVYDVALSGLITPRTLYTQFGDTNNVNTYGYGVLQDVGMKFDREVGVSVTGQGFAQAKATGGTFTASPTQLPLAPILPTHLNYYLDTTGAGIGTTQVPEEFLTVSWDYKGANNPYWATNRSQTSFDTHVNVQPTTEVKIDIAETPLSRTLDAAMSTGTVYFLRVNAQGAQIAGSSPTAYNLLNVDMAIKLTKKDKWQDHQGVYMRTWTFEIVEDATWGHALMITSQSSIATI